MFFNVLLDFMSGVILIFFPCMSLLLCDSGSLSPFYQMCVTLIVAVLYDASSVCTRMPLLHQIECFCFQLFAITVYIWVTRFVHCCSSFHFATILVLRHPAFLDVLVFCLCYKLPTGEPSYQSITFPQN